jgi:L,D-transpeptidase ErfK/SrfK
MELTMFKRIYLILALMIFPLCTFAARYNIEPGSDLVGQTFKVSADSGETLADIGNRYGVGFYEMVDANPSLSQEELSYGDSVVVPAQFVLPKYRKGIVINVAECRLYYFTSNGKSVYTYPVGLGRDGWRTPTTATTIIRKTANPTWTVPSTIRAYVLEQTGNKLPGVVPPGPENPLGPYAMYLGTSGYLIHGTNQPWSIGKTISAGCVRLFNSDVSELYDQVRTGTSVKIINQPYKAGWQNGQLFVEAHMPLNNMNIKPSDLNMVSAERSVLTALQDKRIGVDWDNVREIVSTQNGIPYPVRVGYSQNNDTSSSTASF